MTRMKQDDNADLRAKMVSSQIEGRGVKDRAVLEAMRIVPRERFVSEGMRSYAFDDRALSIGLDQTISQPYMVALMTEVLKVGAGHRVLELGTGSGYQTAVLAKLAGHVYTVERIEKLSTRARQTLGELALAGNVDFLVGDGTLGWPENAPYDRIMVTAGAPNVPDALVEQLVDGGIIVIPVGSADSQVLECVTKREGKLVEKSVVGCRFVKLKGQHGWPAE